MIMYRSATKAATWTLLALGMAFGAGPSQAETTVLTKPNVNYPTFAGVSAPLRDIIAARAAMPQEMVETPAVPRNPVLHPKVQPNRGFVASSGAAVAAPLPLAGTTATVGVNVLGVGVGFHGYSVPDAPTDVNLAVGDTQVVQWVNVHFAIFNKSDGSYVAGPIPGNALWSSMTGSQCANNNSGDISAQWDKVAHRWVLSQPVFSSPFATCFAISQTADAMGAYYLYEFPQNAGFPDYPKVGIWTDGYYQANNLFNAAGTAYLGAQPCAYERDKMLVGDPTAQQQCFLVTGGGTLFDDSMLPADIDSADHLPPAGAEELFLGSIDNHASETHIYKYLFHVDWNTPGNSTFTGSNGSNPVSVATFVGACAFGSTVCIPQKGTTSKLQSLGDRLMYRLAYRRAGPPNNYQSWVVSHSIDNGASVAMRWYEFRAPILFPVSVAPNNFKPRGFALYQQGTYAPDASYRWMGSIAMDKNGNILMGYSRSSSTLYPDIQFTGRAASDALGAMGAEKSIVNQTVATGSQRATGNRWGDYTSMAIDNDGCTFWYSNQYYTVPNSQFAWSTRVASMKFPDCN